MSIDRDNFIKNHTVFPRSFLKGAKVALSYNSIEGRKIDELVNAFLESNFNISSECNRDEPFVPLKIVTEGNVLTFCFEPTECSVEIDAIKGYKSFLYSFFPRTRPLAEFAKDVVGEFGTLRISKENLWVIKTDSPETDLNTGLEFIFRPDRVMELPAITAPTDKNKWGVKTETRPQVFQDMDCLIKLRIEYSDGSLFYNTVIEASTKNKVSYESFPEELLKLNSAVYQLFIDLVSSHVLEMMTKGE